MSFHTRYQRATPATCIDAAHRPDVVTGQWDARRHTDRVAAIPRAGNSTELTTRDRRTTGRLDDPDTPTPENVASRFQGVRVVGPGGGAQ